MLCVASLFSDVEVYIHGIKLSLGVGILSLPYAFTFSGLAVSVDFVPIFAMVLCLTLGFVLGTLLWISYSQATNAFSEY